MVCRGIFLERHCSTRSCLMPFSSLCVHRTVVLWGSHGATLAALLVFLYLCCMDGLCLHHDTASATPAVSGTTVAYDSRKCAEQVISGSRWIRLAIFLITVVLIAACAVVTLVRPFSLQPEELDSKSRVRSAGRNRCVNNRQCFGGTFCFHSEGLHSLHFWTIYILNMEATGLYETSVTCRSCRRSLRRSWAPLGESQMSILDMCL